MTGVLVMMLVMVGVSGVVADEYESVPNDLDYADTDKIVQLVGESMKKQLKHMGQQIKEQIASVEQKVNAVKTEVEQLKQQQDTETDEVKTLLITQIANVVTHEELINHKAKLMSVISGLAKEATLVTKVEEVVALQLLQVSQNINNMRLECISCAKADNLAQVLNLVNSTQRSLTTLTQQMENTSHTLATSCSQGCANVSQTVEELARQRCEVTTSLTSDVGELHTAVDNIQHQLVQVLNYTSPPPPSSILTSTSGGSGERTPCEDSTFVGAQPNFNVCTTAVRFQRCRVNILSYHCCRTCTRSGQIPADGPWRFYNFSRTVKRIQALQLMSLRN